MTLPLATRRLGSTDFLASIPGLPRSVRVLIMRRRQTFVEQCCCSVAGVMATGAAKLRNGRACTNYTPSRNGRCKNVEGALQSRTDALSVQSCAREPERVGNGEGTGGTRVEVAEATSIDGRDGEGIGEGIGEGLHVPNNGVPAMEFAISLAADGAVIPACPEQPSTTAESVTTDYTQINSTSTIADLPSFTPMSTPNFQWGDKDGELFAQSIHFCYGEVVHWKRNLSKIPSGKPGKAFVRKLTRLFRVYADVSTLESVALTTAMVMPALLLQKPNAKSKAKDHAQHLECRLQQWSEGDLEGLMSDGRTIQLHFNQKPQHQRRSDEQTTKTFCQVDDGG